MNIYHKAGIWLAEQHEQGNNYWGACEAITFGLGWELDPPPNVTKFDFMFRPAGDTDDYWGELWGEDKDNCRLLALAFVAAMRDAGDL